MTRFTAALVAAAIALPAAAQSPGSTLAKIRDSRTITLGYRADAAPFSFTGEDKQPAGYVVDLCKRVVASMTRAITCRRSGNIGRPRNSTRSPPGPPTSCSSIQSGPPSARYSSTKPSISSSIERAASAVASIAFVMSPTLP